MTWQRIDENMYIDDTLVTCAEYQLFIDEMIIMGHYFQPDHWTALQFQSGHANNPILGVRRSDAGSFCDWLTQGEETEKWRFRLPTFDEAKSFLPSFAAQSSFGYWTEGNTEETKFVWFGPAPSDARKISCDLARDFDCKRSLDLDSITSTLRDPSGVTTKTHGHVVTRQIELDIGLALSRPRVMDLTHINAGALALTRAHELSLIQNWGVSVASDLAQAIVNARDIAIDISQDHDPLVARARDIALDIYIDLFTLQERIAGRSPAFEGIRLVKGADPLTWQRIDDDIYIDDTLVTCAEYQLFIDEMREQGMHYQPDQWTTYQFPQGQAHTPIKGVRFSDGKAFSKWLTDREGGIWIYRVPFLEEVYGYSIINKYRFPMGYWFTDKKGLERLGTAGNTRTETNGWRIERSLQEKLSDASIRLYGYGDNTDRKLDGGRAFDRARNLKLVGNKYYRNLNIDSLELRAKEHDPILALSCNFFLDRNLNNDETLHNSLLNLQDKEIIYLFEIARSVHAENQPNRIQAIEFCIIYACSLVIKNMAGQPLPATVDAMRALGMADTWGFIGGVDNSIALIVDLITYSERIAGHSPAFEGIRLVKERIR